MILIPHKNEIAAIAAILDNDDEGDYIYETSEEMAVAVIKTVAQLLSERDTIGVSVHFPRNNADLGNFEGGLAIGPFYDRRDALRCLQDAREAGLDGRTARLSGTGSIRPAIVRDALCECGHRKELHPKSDRCKVLPTCPCKGYESRA